MIKANSDTATDGPDAPEKRYPQSVLRMPRERSIRLPTDFSDEPAGKHGDEIPTASSAMHQYLKPAGIEQPLPKMEHSGNARPLHYHQHPDADHDAKGPEDPMHRRSLVFGPFFETSDLPV
jgi:hypothetical protein